MAGEDKGGRWWPGGYKHKQKDGRTLFIIERRVAKQRFHVSTRCHNLTAAMKQLERFEADPFGYSPAGQERAAPIVITDELVLAFRVWSTDVRGNTRKHANEMSHRLFDWMEDLKGADLRHVTMRDHIKPALERRTTCRQHRIIALKSFYAWLRKERNMLTSAQDPTLDLAVPGAVPEKRKRRKALEHERFRAVFDRLDGAQRDCLHVLAATGWHVTELARFIRSSESAIVLQPKDSGVLASLVTRHKGGGLTHTPILHTEQLEAAQRLRAEGQMPARLNAAVKAACKAAGMAPFTLGVMRHSVATWAVELGAAPAQVAQFLGHKDPRTTERFYIDVGAPTVSVPVLRLVRG